MVANYFTLLHLTKSLSARLTGLSLRALYSQQRRTLVLEARMEDREEWIEISCDASANFILPRARFARARSNSIDVFPELIGSLIVAASIHPSDRQISIRFESDERLLIQMFGSSANVHWVSPTNLVRASFLAAKSLDGTLLLDTDAKPLKLPASVADLTPYDDGADVRTLLRNALPQLGPLYGREVLARAGLNGAETLSELTATRQNSLIDALRSVLTDVLDHPLPLLYERTDEGPIFSLCRLDHLTKATVTKPETLEEAIALWVAGHHRSKGFLEEKKLLLSQLDRTIRRTEQTLEKVTEESRKASRADQYERFGSLVMASLQTLTKGMTAIECEDIFDPARPILQIPLEKGLSPTQNAERYFSKAKKARLAAADTAHRITSLTKELAEARVLHGVVQTSESRDDLRTCVSDHRSMFKKFGISTSPHGAKDKEPYVPFRVFKVAGNFTVWAGKSSENNDVLTMKHARPNDLWFHARGSGGSHVVLRTGTGKGEISKRAMEEAASIAAYYSKMKNASTVPVAMTYRKYIRKPKGAPPGTVVIEREKVLFVEPRLPQHHVEEEPT